MTQESRPTSYKEFRRHLLAIGACLIRSTGGHEQWRLPNGRRWTLSMSKGQWTHRRTVLNRWREFCRVVSEPPKEV